MAAERREPTSHREVLPLASVASLSAAGVVVALVVGEPVIAVCLSFGVIVPPLRLARVRLRRPGARVLALAIVPLEFALSVFLADTFDSPSDNQVIYMVVAACMLAMGAIGTLAEVEPRFGFTEDSFGWYLLGTGSITLAGAVVALSLG